MPTGSLPDPSRVQGLELDLWSIVDGLHQIAWVCLKLGYTPNPMVNVGSYMS